jgi:carbamoylphosphate synthase large subunit
MPTIWFNQGYSVVRDALLLIRDGAAQAGVRDLVLIASHEDPYAGALDVADRAFLEPRRGSPDAYAAWCARFCLEHGVDLFIVQRGAPAVVARRHLFPPTTRILVAGDAPTLERIADKDAFYAAVHAAGLPAPISRAVSTPAEFDAACADLAARGLPACVKPRRGVFGQGFWRLDPDAGLMQALIAGDDRRIAPALIRQALADAADPPALLVMEYLPGPEWSLDCVCERGRLVVGVARRKRGRVQELEVDGPIFDIARAAVDLFGLSGLVNVQLKAADEAGEDPRLLEINPRMSGGVARSRFAGVNLPWRNLALQLGLDAGEAEVPVGGALVAAHETGAAVRPMAGGATVHA